jgi:Tfp pilus assembly protein PilX
MTDPRRHGFNLFFTVCVFIFLTLLVLFIMRNAGA